MPDPAPRDYTTRQLAEGAERLHAAVELLGPAADMLTHTADEFLRSAEDAGDVDLGEQAVRITRTARNLTAIALDLKCGEAGLIRLTRSTGRIYRAITSWLSGLVCAALGLSAALGLLGLLPGHLPLGDAAGVPAAYAIGVATANVIIWRRTRPAKG